MTQHHPLRLIPRLRPAEFSSFQAFGANPKTAPIPVKDLQSVSSGINKQKQVAAPDFQTEFVSG
jgi:hypothetical protein